MTVAVDGARLTGELEELAGLTDCAPAKGTSLPEPLKAVTRIVFTRRDMEARDFLKDLATEAGLSLREDAAGNTFFRWEGSEPELAAVGT